MINSRDIWSPGDLNNNHVETFSKSLESKTRSYYTWHSYGTYNCKVCLRVLTCLILFPTHGIKRSGRWFLKISFTCEILWPSGKDWVWDRDGECHLKVMWGLDSGGAYQREQIWAPNRIWSRIYWVQDRHSGEPSDLVRRSPLGHGGEQHRGMAKSFMQQ